MRVPVVYARGMPIAFGSPCDWAVGVAARVLSREYRLATVHFKLETHEDDQDAVKLEIPLFAIETAGRNFLDHRAHSHKGSRRRQEDRYHCAVEMDKSDAYPYLCKIGLPALSFFAVYDGHGGDAAAEFLRENLHKNFAHELGCQAHARRCRVCLRAAMHDAFSTTDAAICQRSIEQLRQPGGARNADEAAGDAARAFSRATSVGSYESPGAAAVASVICGQELLVAHVGDCRAVLTSVDGSVVLLTKDHNIKNYRERERVIKEGGRWDQDRLNSFLEISRAFGDVDLSCAEARWVLVCACVCVCVFVCVCVSV